MAGPPAPEEPTGAAIRRSVLRQTALHPLTVLPTGLAALTALGSVVVGPPAILLGASMLLGSLGMGSFAVNYFLRPETFANRYVRRMEARRQAARGQEVLQLRKELVSLGSDAGVKAWDELAAAHGSFRKALDKREAEGVALDVSTLRQLADRTLDEGLAHLRAFVSTARALKIIDAPKLRAEAEQIRQRVTRLAKRDDDEARRTREALEGQLASIDSRIGKHREGEVRLEEILASCERCEAVLESGALELSTMREVTARFVQDAAEGLEANLTVARRFNEALHGKGEDVDRIYDRVPDAPGAASPEAPGKERGRSRETE